MCSQWVALYCYEVRIQPCASPFLKKVASQPDSDTTSLSDEATASPSLIHHRSLLLPLSLQQGQIYCGLFLWLNIPGLYAPLLGGAPPSAPVLAPGAW